MGTCVLLMIYKHTHLILTEQAMHEMVSNTLDYFTYAHTFPGLSVVQTMCSWHQLFSSNHKLHDSVIAAYL